MGEEGNRQDQRIYLFENLSSQSGRPGMLAISLSIGRNSFVFIEFLSRSVFFSNFAGTRQEHSVNVKFHGFSGRNIQLPQELVSVNANN